MHDLTGPARPTGAPALGYDTEARADGGAWRPAPRLAVQVDRGGPSELVELAWRSESGAEAVLAFTDGMRAFRGHRRRADGVREEYRGVAREGGGSPEKTGARSQVAECRSLVFATEEERPDGGRGDAGRLRLLLDDGQGPVERITWRDAGGTFVSLAPRTGADGAAAVPVPVARVIASAEYAAAGEVAAHLLSPGPGKWLAFDSAATLDFVLPEPTVVTGYRLTSAGDCRDRDPRDWRLRGSVDGTTWYTLDLRDGQTFPERHLRRAYEVANSTAYPRYRLDIDRNWGRQAETQLGRVELFTTDEAQLLGTPLPLPRIQASGENWSGREYATHVRTSDAGKWLTFTGAAWLEFTLDEPAVVTGYTLTSANDHCSRDPKDWVLLGSDDGGDWTVLDRRAGELFPERFQVREFATGTTTPYSRYRLHITANAENVGEIQLNRVQLLAAGAGGPRPVHAEFSGVLRRGTGPAVGYRGTALPRDRPVAAREEGPAAGADGKWGRWGQSTPAAPVVPGLPEVEWRPLPESWTPGMRDDVVRFRAEALGRGVPPQDVERWLELARRCVVVAPEADGPVVGHLGNPAPLPPGTPVPPRQRPVATLDLAAVPEDATNLPLPRDGRLLLLAWPHLDVAEDRDLTSGGSALYVPAGAAVVERHVTHDCPPLDFLADVDFDGELRGELRMAYDLSLPDHDFTDDPITDAHPHARTLREAWSHVRRDRHAFKRSHLRIGGHASDGEGWGDPVRECAREERPPAGEEPRPEDWVLLAEWQPAMRGLESVTLYWALRERDLAAGDLEGVRVAMWANP